MQTNPGAGDTRLRTPPRGIVTFLFTDIEGSTTLLQRIGPLYTTVLLDHHRLLRAAWVAHQGYEVDTQGDSFFVTFPSVREAVAAAAEATQALATYAWPDGVNVRVRMGLHTGTADLVGEHYIGLDVHRAARIAAAGHGGQILLSQTTVELVRETLPAGVTMRDLGAHRLKDLLRPEPLYQLVLPGLPDTFPPLKTLDRAPNNLPVLPTPLVGRERERADLCSLLAQPDGRLVTLLGPGGVGKTSLAIQVAADLSEHFPDGVYIAALAPVSDGTAILPTLMQTLGLREVAGEPLDETLRAFLRAKRLLLVLDNLEQIAAPVAAVAATLLSSTAHVAILATSRAALRVRGEREYIVPPLGLPDSRRLPELAEIATYPAIQLFLQRAIAARHDFTLTPANAPAIAQVCALVDGLPLALELAAARIKVLSVAALAQRLAPDSAGSTGASRLHLLAGGARDLPARQRSISDTIAWSYSLLRPEEQALFRRLAVFVDGWALEAAEAVATAGGEVPLDLIDGLTSLVDQSLVRREDALSGDVRFGMLQVIREFGLRQLAEAGEASAVSAAHAAYFLSLAEEAERHEFSPEEPAWIALLNREHENLLAALSWARDTRQVVLGLRLAGLLGPFWNIRGAITEGRGWLEEFLAMEPPARAGDTDAITAGVLARYALGENLRRRADNEAAQSVVEQALTLARASGDLKLVARVLVCLGNVAVGRRAPASASTYYGEALALAREHDQRLVPELLVNLGVSMLDQHELDRAAAFLEEAEGIIQRQGHDRAVVYVRTNRGLVALARGDAAEAAHLFRPSLRLAWERHLPYEVAFCLEYLAEAVVGLGSDELAARLLGMAEGLWQEIGASRAGEDQERYDEAVATLRARMGTAWYEAAFAVGRAADREVEIPKLFGAESGANQ